VTPTAAACVEPASNVSLLTGSWYVTVHRMTSLHAHVSIAVGSDSECLHRCTSSHTFWLRLSATASGRYDIGGCTRADHAPRPWRVETFNSNEPRSADKLVDVVGLYFVCNSKLSNRVMYGLTLRFGGL
jgi:hypothetical protein